MRRLLTISVLLLALCTGVRAEGYVFSHLNTTNSSLSFNKVHVVTQDSNGFIWMGTAYGLDRFDGRNIRTFDASELGLGSAFIVSLCADDKGNLWIGTDSGITCYNYLEDRFVPLLMASDKGTTVTNKVSRIALDRSGTVWFSVLNQGLFSYDGQNLVNWFWEDGRMTLPDGIRALFIDNNNVFWLSLYFNDLYYSDDGLKTVKPAGIGPGGNWFVGDDIMAIWRDPVSGELLTASNNRGLCAVDTRTKTVRTLVPNDERFVVEQMHCDNERRVWLSTTKGVYCHYLDEGRTEHLKADASDPYGLSENHVFYTYTDRSGGLWLCTYSHGVDYSGHSQSLFRKYRQTSDGGSLAGSLVRHMASDGNGKVWITTEERGLYCWDRRSGELTRYASRRLPDILFGLCYDDGRLWIGSFDGMYRLDTRTGALKLYSSSDDSSPFKDGKIYSITKTSGADIYFGTTLGLFKYDRGLDTFTSIDGFAGIFVTDILEDHTGKLWLASYADGIFRYDTADGNIEHWSKQSAGDGFIPTDKILSLTEGSDGSVWAATFGAGFLVREPLSDSFRAYDRNSLPSMPSEVIYRILEDSGGNMWMSSNKGLMEFRPENGHLRTFTTADGLLDDEFNYMSACRCQDGRLLFGSKNGLTVFNPADVTVGDAPKTVFLSDFEVGDALVHPAAKGSYLKKNINETSHITLRPNDNSFSVVVSLSESSTAAGVYCRLEGFDTKWREPGLDGRMNWENVPAGRYHLTVRGSEGSLHAPVEIIVLQKFYKTTWAIALYVIVFILLILGFVLYMSKKANQHAEQERRSYALIKDEELLQEKMSFFAGVIHEIKTPLTLIKTPLENIKITHASDTDIREDLDVISNSADYLDQLVRELLDFIRIEEHGYVLEYKQIDLVEKINFMCFNYREAASARNIEIHFTHDDPELILGADSSALGKILNNLLSNAVKYAKSSIEIKVWREDASVVVTFSNDGPAIPAAQRREIFKPFVHFPRGDSYSSSFGIGLSLARTLAELHAGSLVLEDAAPRTTFRLTLPMRLVEAETLAPDTEQLPSGNDNLPLLLVVEDNSSLLAYLESKLSDTYRILTATSAEKALRLLGKWNVDIVLTDISLTGMSGIELCRRVKSEMTTAHIPVIMLSAITSPETKVLCMENGADQYIEKPFQMEYLRACLKAGVDKHLSVRRLSSQDKDIPIVISGGDEEFIRKLDAVIRDNISDPELSNERIASDLFISKTSLVRKVKGLLGTTPGDYVRTVRLNLAARMLQKDGTRISDVCYAVGFNTPSYFAKCFKRQFGLLPAEYIRQNKEKQS